MQKNLKDGDGVSDHFKCEIKKRWSDKGTIYAGFKCRIYPTKEQADIIAKTVECCRFVYNHFVEDAYAACMSYRQANPIPTPFKRTRDWRNEDAGKQKALLEQERERYLAALPALIRESPSLKEVDRYAIEGAIGDLVDAEKRFLDVDLDSELPKVKSGVYGGSFNATVKNVNVISKDGRGGRKVVEEYVISTPVYGQLKCRRHKSRPPEGAGRSTETVSSLLPGGAGNYLKARYFNVPEGVKRPVGATISMAASGNYYISLGCATPMKKWRETGAVVGVDLGVGENFAVTSDGDTVPRFFAGRGKKDGHANAGGHDRELQERHLREWKRVMRLQKALFRKDKTGHNYAKNRIEFARLHERIRHQMHDIIQKETTRLVENYDVICIENIDTSKIRENKSYSKQMLDSLFFEFRRELEYKTPWYGKTLIIVSADGAPSLTPRSASEESAKALLAAGLKALEKREELRRKDGKVRNYIDVYL